jgi:monoamine oxidase
MPAGPAPPPIEVPTNYTGCDITIAGGGAGGMYSAWRLVKDVGVSGSTICIFEADTRLGGRIYSIRGQVRHAGQAVLARAGRRRARAPGAADALPSPSTCRLLCRSAC